MPCGLSPHAEPTLEETLQFLARHGYVVLFLFVLAEQVGLPLPAIPSLLAVGALCRTGHMDLGFALAVAVGASILADLMWYEIGRRRGGTVLGWLCRISLEPDSCVRRTEDLFTRHGARSLIIAKFVPGLNTAAPPLSGMLRMHPGRFLAYDVAGATLWIGCFIALGYAFSSQLERALEWAVDLGGLLGALVFGPLVVYLLFKYLQRARGLREMRMARIDSAELYRLIKSESPVTILDMRHPLELEAEPESIPGARRVLPEEIERAVSAIPRNGEVILFCT